MNSALRTAAEDMPRVMLVEDEEAIRRLFLSTYGDFNLVVVENVDQAVRALEKERERIGVLLADHYLPDGTGVEVLSWARQNLPETVRLLTTSHAHLSQAVAAVNSGGISGYITKPWSLPDLRITLRKSLETYIHRRREIELLAGKRATLMSLATSIAHEMRTPLATIRLRADAVGQYWPMLMDLYREAVACGRLPPMRQGKLDVLAKTPDVIAQEVERSNLVIDMLLASANVGRLDKSSFALHSIGKTVREALGKYPFESTSCEKVVFEDGEEFVFFGSDVLVLFVLYNLLKNAFHAIKSAGKGEVRLFLERGTDFNFLTVHDTGLGIPEADLPHIFEDFFTTKRVGTGVGLSFCRNAMRAMGGDIECKSRRGEFARFSLCFPVVRNAS